MGTSEWLQTHGVELVDTPDALLGSSERGGFVKLARRHGEFVAVKVVEGGRVTSMFSSLPPAPQHRNLVTVLDRLSYTGVDGGRWAEVRAICPGGELYDRIAEEGAMPATEAVAVFAQITGAVAHSHSCGVAHGQLRPEHVLLDDKETIQLLGFVHHTKHGSIPLRPVRPLDAPEWHRDGGLGSCPAAKLLAADVWALGVLLLVLLNGGQPFNSPIPERCPRYAAFLCTGALTDLIGPAAAGLPEWLSSLIVRSLQPDPAERPTASQLVAAFVQHGATAGWATPLSTPTPSIPSPLQSVASAGGCAPHAALVVSTAPSAAASGADSAAEPASCASSPAAAVESPLNSWAAGWEAGWQAAKSLLKGESSAARAPTQPGERPLAMTDHDLMPPPRGSGLKMYGKSRPPERGGPAADGPPLRPSPQQGYVRSLGWEGLPQPLEVLINAVSASLVSLDVPFAMREVEYRFVVRPVQDSFGPPPEPQSDSPRGEGPHESPGALALVRTGKSRGVEAPADSVDDTPSLHQFVIFIQIFRESQGAQAWVVRCVHACVCMRVRAHVSA